jgi:hypothetical protein
MQRKSRSVVKSFALLMLLYAITVDRSSLTSGPMQMIHPLTVSWIAQRTDPWRFGVRMGYKLRRHWRKSSQWFALTRKHADLVMADTELLDIFKAHCKNGWDNDLNRCTVTIMPPTKPGAELLGAFKAVLVKF